MICPEGSNIELIVWLVKVDISRYKVLTEDSIILLDYTTCYFRNKVIKKPSKGTLSNIRKSHQVDVSIRASDVQLVSGKLGESIMIFFNRAVIHFGLNAHFLIFELLFKHSALRLTIINIRFLEMICKPTGDVQLHVPPSLS